MIRIGHRGAAALAPENTLASFRKAVELGVDGVEFDVQRTRDGALVVIHDEAVDRTTNGKGPVAAFTLEELRRLDAGSWKGDAFAGARVPTLEDVIRTVPAPVALFVELKDPSRYPGIEREVIAALRRAAVLERSGISSFDHASLARVREADREVRLGFLYDRHPDPVGAAGALAAAAVHPPFQAVDGELVARAHDAGLAVLTWTVNEPADIARARALGVDGVFSDHPERL